MKQHDSFNPPKRLLITDTIGSLLLIIGLLALLFNVELLPEKWQFPNYAIYITLLGGVFMIPSGIFLLKWIIKSTGQDKEI
ncbi:DUF1418 family protein [Dongshaea marina]|uniref:DUF1418 family protein n=1 Tax=Dongshaea marina TaxID=2047966 RepID=UPI000D3E534F|nr:DUF1418 family protein [Dongshaea marina]